MKSPNRKMRTVFDLKIANAQLIFVLVLVENVAQCVESKIGHTRHTGEVEISQIEEIA